MDFICEDQPSGQRGKHAEHELCAGREHIPQPAIAQCKTEKRGRSNRKTQIDHLVPEDLGY